MTKDNKLKTMRALCKGCIEECKQYYFEGDGSFFQCRKFKWSKRR